MILVLVDLRISIGGIKENDGGGELNYDIL
jgi:hypothetical protein